MRHSVWSTNCKYKPAWFAPSCSGVLAGEMTALEAKSGVAGAGLCLTIAGVVEVEVSMVHETEEGQEEEEAASGDVIFTGSPDGTTEKVEAAKDGTLVDPCNASEFAGTTFSSDAAVEGGGTEGTAAWFAAAGVSPDTAMGGLITTAESLEVITANVSVCVASSIVEAGNVEETLGVSEDWVIAQGTQMLMGDTVSTRYTGCKAAKRSG